MRLEQDGENKLEAKRKTIDIYEYLRAKELIDWANACAFKDEYKRRAIVKTKMAEEDDKTSNNGGRECRS